MNTSAAAKKLGVSPKTVQRWIKQLDLRIERNDLGHYMFSEQDINLLQNIHEQIQNGVAIKDLTIPEQAKHEDPDIHTSTSGNGHDHERLWAKLKSLELMMYQKADDVVSYQLLQHRQEMEELQARIEELEARIVALEKEKRDEKTVSFEPTGKKRMFRRGFISSIFGL
ncbi:MerR family transcriptional regulator [Bacillus sp. FJAT-47783]|uniref:MerR family transcriptional regulator n=1 Tax=Bacillus sp. FJAT-47783 TaxID=2922712 RepID=UPI001FABADCF|nr:MerR family transcriptional regulator [Bacillus sp. FJAT-47783]